MNDGGNSVCLLPNKKKKQKTWIILGGWEWMMSSNILNNAIYECKHY